LNNPRNNVELEGVTEKKQGDQKTILDSQFIENFPAKKTINSMKQYTDNMIIVIFCLKSFKHSPNKGVKNWPGFGFSTSRKKNQRRRSGHLIIYTFENKKPIIPKWLAKNRRPKN
jgi:hypothetical protein